jgi:hypothetical protein
MIDRVFITSILGYAATARGFPPGRCIGDMSTYAGFAGVGAPASCRIFVFHVDYSRKVPVMQGWSSTWFHSHKYFDHPSESFRGTVQPPLTFCSKFSIINAFFLAVNHKTH